MYYTPEVKKVIIEKFGKNSNDTGSPEVQIALLTYRIQHLTEHLKKNKKDKVTQRALIAMVNKRRRQLNYLKDVDYDRYRAILEKLQIRK